MEASPKSSKPLKIFFFVYIQYQYSLQSLITLARTPDPVISPPTSMVSMALLIWRVQISAIPYI
jgi:hypothetical protein